jgi:hypothetical protein
MLRFYSNLMIIFYFIKNMSQFLPVALPLELGALQINLCQGTNEDRELDGASIRTKTILVVKVLWRNHGVEDASWEAEQDMWSCYPHLFE